MAKQITAIGDGDVELRAQISRIRGELYQAVGAVAADAWAPGRYAELANELSRLAQRLRCYVRCLETQGWFGGQP